MRNCTQDRQKACTVAAFTAQLPGCILFGKESHTFVVVGAQRLATPEWMDLPKDAWVEVLWRERFADGAVEMNLWAGTMTNEPHVTRKVDYSQVMDGGKWRPMTAHDVGRGTARNAKQAVIFPGDLPPTEQNVEIVDVTALRGPPTSNGSETKPKVDAATAEVAPTDAADPVLWATDTSAFTHGSLDRRHVATRRFVPRRSLEALHAGLARFFRRPLLLAAADADSASEAPP